MMGRERERRGTGKRIKYRKGKQGNQLGAQDKVMNKQKTFDNTLCYSLHVQCIQYRSVQYRSVKH